MTLESTLVIQKMKAFRKIALLTQRYTGLYIENQYFFPGLQ